MRARSTGWVGSKRFGKKAGTGTGDASPECISAPGGKAAAVALAGIGERLFAELRSRPQRWLRHRLQARHRQAYLV